MGMILVVLIASAGVVVITVALSGSTSSQKVSESTRKGNIIRSAITTYTLSHGGTSGTRPATLDHLTAQQAGEVACAANTTTTSATYRTLQGWCGPYVDRTLNSPSSAAADWKTDAWGTLFSWTQGTNTLKSCGPNLNCGDSDDLSF